MKKSIYNSNKKSIERRRINQLEKKLHNLEKIKKKNDSTQSRYRSLFEMSDDAILVIENHKFVDCNKAVVKMLGYKSKSQLLNTHPSELSPYKQPDGRLSYEKAQEMMKLAMKNGSHHFEWIHTRANGENFPVEVWLSKVKYDGKKIINTVWRDLTEKKKAEAEIQKNLKEKEILLKEIHHRVKNNLQIISSLLNLQLNHITDSQLRNILLSSKNRIHSMCKIHEMLYQSKDLSHIEFGKYVNELLQNLAESVKGPHHNIKITTKIKNLFLNINTAIPLGLLMNEIVSNALKHGIINNKKGKISVIFQERKNGKHIMEISDDGIGYNGNHKNNKTQSLGFQLMNSLTEQLNGKLLKLNSKKGTKYRLEFELI
jgi:PAS domain S-box-containing protein